MIFYCQSKCDSHNECTSTAIAYRISGMEKLTDVQAKVLRYVKRAQKEKQSPPSRTEIARHFGWASVNAAQDVLKALERKGYIRLSPGVARGIYVL